MWPFSQSRAHVEYVPLGTSDEAHVPPHSRRRRPAFFLRLLRGRGLLIAAGALIAALLLVMFRVSSSSPSHPPPPGDPRNPPLDPLPAYRHNATETDPHAANPYFEQMDIWAHNAKILKKLERCEELGLLGNTSEPYSFSLRSAEDEAAAAEQGCGWNETTVVLISSYWLATAAGEPMATGETVYGRSVVSSLNANGYAFVFASRGWLNHDMRLAMEYYRKISRNVRFVLADPEQIDVCFDTKLAEEQECLKTETNLDGVPAWRLLAFWYWDTPLGREFTLSPTDKNDNYFISYSIELTCAALPYIPPAERQHPPQAYILAKQIHYLGPKLSPHKPGRFAWTIDGLAGLRDLEINVVGGMLQDELETAVKAHEAGIINYGKLSRDDFYSILSHSFVLLGVGQPRISPSPWDALCQGVPFINPILEWDHDQPQNRSAWQAQQWRMTHLDPPYVYHVHAGDISGLRAAVLAALEHPIDRFVPDTMRFEFVKQRMAGVLERDWRAVGEKVRDEWIKNGTEPFLM